MVFEGIQSFELGSLCKQVVFIGRRSLDAGGLWK